MVWGFVTMGGVVVAMFGIASRGAIFASAARQWKPGVIAGALSIVTYGMALWAFSLGPTAPLAALRETGMVRSEEHTSELQSLMRISYAVFCLKKKKTHKHTRPTHIPTTQSKNTHNTTQRTTQTTT